VVTKLTEPPALGRGLLTATGHNAEAVAGSARAAGQVYEANIPNTLISQLESIGLARRVSVAMGGATGSEIRFLPAASEWIVRFFEEVP
jgi:hypothetical protein